MKTYIKSKNKLMYNGICLLVSLILCAVMVTSCQKEEVFDQSQSEISENIFLLKSNVENYNIEANRAGCPSFSNKLLGACQPPHFSVEGKAYRGFKINSKSCSGGSCTLRITEYFGNTCETLVSYTLNNCPVPQNPCDVCDCRYESEMNRESQQAIARFLKDLDGDMSKEILTLIIVHQRELTRLFNQNDELQMHLKSFWKENKDLLETSFSDDNSDYNKIVRQENVLASIKVLEAVEQHTKSPELKSSIENIKQNIYILEGKTIKKGLKSFDQLSFDENSLN